MAIIARGFQPLEFVVDFHSVYNLHSCGAVAQTSLDVGNPKFKSLLSYEAYWVALDKHTVPTA